MGNEMMGNGTETAENKKSLLLIIGIVAAALVVVLIVFYAVATSPRALTATLIKNTPDAIVDFFEEDSGDMALFMTESHQSETVIKMDGEEFGVEGDIKLELDTGYLNSTGDFLTELQLGLGDMDAITGGLYLKESELALLSSLLVDKYVLDLELEDELGKDTPLYERLDASSKEDEEKIADLEKRVEDKMAEYRKFAIQVLPRGSIEKSNDSLEIMGKDQKTKCIEIALDEDDLKDWLELIFEKAADDEELEELVKDIVDYANEAYDTEELDTDDIDLEESMEEAIDELEDLEAEVELKIYYDGFKPLAYSFEYKDEYDKAEMMAMLYRKGSDKELTVNYEDDYDEFYLDVQETGEFEGFAEVKINDMSVDVTIEKVKNGVYEISGSMDSGYGMKGDISGEIIDSRKETSFEVKYELEDEYSSIELNIEGSVVEEGSVTTYELEEKFTIDDEDFMELSFELETEELRKNKEYETKGEVKLVVPDEGLDVTVDIESITIYGSEAEVDLPSWSKSDVYAKASDQEKMQELIDSLIEDFYNGISEFMYGGMY